MARKNPNLHGNVPDKNPLVLVIIDVINDLEFTGGEAMLRHAKIMAPNLARLKERAYKANVPVIYVNDNFGKWRSDFSAQVDHCLNDRVRGESIVKLLQPTPRDYYILKPKHSAFFSTPLEMLLNYLRAKTLILTGIAGNNCVLFTANDAYLREFEVIVPSDCVVSLTKSANTAALKQLESLVKADIRPSENISFRRHTIRNESAKKRSS